MEIILCNKNHLKDLTEFYNKVVLHLEKTINYPHWVYGIYPCEFTINEDINKKQQYACIENGKIIGGFVLNEDPGGKIENAKIKYKRGEFLIIHTLATDVDKCRKGVASRMIKFCKEKAKKDGYKALYADVVPTNIPSQNLFKKCGFTYLGDFDLERTFDKSIPLFSIYELEV